MYVSRAGEKLQYALETFNISVQGLTCADFGCSTGGFTDCLLQNGAKKVYAVDTGYGVLDWGLRNNDKVIVMERTNALHVQLPEKCAFISVDVSWTPQKRIIPHAITQLKKGGTIVSLLKPHYEADKSLLIKGVLDEKYHQDVIAKVKDELNSLNIKIKDITKSPIKGDKGKNTEYLMYIQG